MASTMLAYHEHYTVKDYSLWEGDWELIGGMPYAMAPSPSVSHQIIVGNILTQLNISINNTDDCNDCHALIEIDWEISHDTVVKPDVLILCDAVDEKVVKTPQIIFEVSSPTTAKRDELVKFQLYEKEAVLYYILVYPETNVVKIYLWPNGSYQKVKDLSSEIFIFKLEKCSLTLDFSTIWR